MARRDRAGASRTRPGRSRSEAASLPSDAAIPDARPSADLLALQRLISRRADGEPAALDGAQVHEAADIGTRGASGPLPHLDVIQRSFGKHDVSSVAAHTDEAAAAASQSIDALAFTTVGWLTTNGDAYTGDTSDGMLPSTV